MRGQLREPRRAEPGDTALMADTTAAGQDQTGAAVARSTGRTNSPATRRLESGEREEREEREGSRAAAESARAVTLDAHGRLDDWRTGGRSHGV